MFVYEKRQSALLGQFILLLTALKNGRFRPGNRVPAARAWFWSYRSVLLSCMGIYGKAMPAHLPGRLPSMTPQVLGLH